MPGSSGAARWELRLKVLAVAGVAIGVAEYLHTVSRESQKPFLEKQVKRGMAKDLFLEMYWGRLGIVEDVGVTKPMIDYKNAVIDGGESSDPPTVLALKIGFACRDLT